MKFLLGVAVILLLAGCAGSGRTSLDAEAAPIPVAASELEACGVDEAEQTRLLALSPEAFDQDIDGGWRVLGERSGCLLAAATLLEAYIVDNRIDPDDGVMHWHVGQLLALAGENEAAIPWLTTTSSQIDPAWNHYVDGTIAFLTQDRSALEASTDSLAVIEVSEIEQAMRRQFLEDNPDFTAPDGFVDEPPNLSVLRGLLDCFEQPYSVAYGCRP